MHRFRKRDSWTPKGANNGHVNSNNDQFFCIYKRWLSLQLKKWNNAGADVIVIHYKGENKPALWPKIKDIGEKLDVKNICDLVDKEIKGKFETNYPT